MKRICATLLFITVFFTSAVLPAAEYTWTGAAHDGNYANPTNWLNGQIPVADGTDIVYLANEGVGTLNLGLIPIRLKKLVFQNTSASYIFAGNGATFELTDGIGLSTGNVYLNNLTLKITGQQTFSSTQGTLILNGVLTGAGSVIQTGNGVVRLTRDSTAFTGSITLSEGTLQLDTLRAAGFAQLFLKGGTLELVSPGTLANNITFSPGTEIGGININGDTTLTGHIMVASNATIAVNGPGQLTLAGTISSTVVDGQNRLIITGNSKVVLSATSDFVGNLRVENGVVILNTPNSLPQTSSVKISTGYIGYTENFSTSFSSFLTRIKAITDPNAIVGIDSVNPTITRTISDAINLSIINELPRTTPYYLGTTSHIKLTGQITPTLLAAGGYDSLYLTAIYGGYLNVASTLGGPLSHVDSVVIGQPTAIQPHAGTVELSGNNTYTGNTTVLGGVLQVNGSKNLGTGIVTVANGATLNLGSSGTIGNTISLNAGSTISGNGTITSLLTIGNGVNLIPGGIGKIGEMHVHGGIVFEAGAIWHIDLASNSSDEICVWNTAAINGNHLIPITVNLYSVNGSGVEGALTGFDFNGSHTWTIAYRPSNVLTITGFDPSYFSIDATKFNQWNGDKGLFNIEQINNSLAITFTPVPEPGTYALMALGIGTLALLEIRRRRKS